MTSQPPAVPDELVERAWTAWREQYKAPYPLPYDQLCAALAAVLPDVEARVRRECAEEARDPIRRLTSALIAVEHNLDKPYPDDPRWTPWTRWVEPALKAVRALADSWEQR